MSFISKLQSSSTMLEKLARSMRTPEQVKGGKRKRLSNKACL